MNSRLIRPRFSGPLFLSLAALAPAALMASPWTVDLAVATALRQSPDVQSARHRIEAGEAMLEQVNSAWQPQVTLAGGYTRTNGALGGLGFALGQRAFSPTLDLNRPGWTDNLNITGTVAYNLYDGGRPTARRDAARAGVRAAEQDLRALQLQLASDVARALLNLRKAREAVAAVESALKAHQANAADARLRFEAGQVLKADLLSLEVQSARTREQLSSARHAAALAARMFTFLLGGVSAEETVELPAYDTALAALTAPESRDFSQRPDLQRLRERVRTAESLLTAARGGQRPAVNAFISGQHETGWHFGRSSGNVQGGVAVELNVFDGGRNAGQVRAAAAELAQAKEDLRRAELAIGLEVERARLAHQDAVERLQVMAGAVTQAEESASLSRARFSQGVLLTSELLGSESRLMETRLGRTLAAADERLALVDLRRAHGLPVVTLP